MTLSAFGSYLEPQTIEFGKFGASALFLITGATGGGKTTVLNAITYALYGEKNDGDKDVRTSYATPEYPTFVEMIFEVSGKQYRIKRSPAYIGMHKRFKDKTAKQTPNLEFYERVLEDGKFVETDLGSKISDITQQAINEKVGRDFKQFMMTSMMRQNGFVELLNSSTNTRIGIFRTLFKTEKYDELKNKFDFLFNEANASYTQTKGKIVEEFNKVKVTGNVELGIKLDELKKISFENKIAETISLLEEIVDYNEKEAEKSSSKLQENANAIGRLQSIAENKSKVDAIQNDIPVLNSEITDLASKVNSAKETQDAAQEAYDRDYEKCVAEVVELKNKAELFSDIIQNKNAIQSADKEIDTANNEKTRLDGEISKKEEKVNEYAKFLTDNKDIPVLKASLVSQKSSLELTANKLDEKRNKVLELQRENKKLDENIKKINEKIKSAKEKVAENTKLVKESQNAKDNYANLQISINDYSHRFTETENLLSDIRTYEEEQVNISTLGFKYRTSKEKVDKQIAMVKTIESSLLKQKGFAIASELKEGDICPVCGNHYVPGKVAFVSEEYTEDDLLKARNTKTELETEADKEYGELNDKISRNKAKLDDIVEKGTALVGASDISQVKNKTAKLNEELQSEVNKLTAEANAQKELADCFDERNENLKTSESSLASLNSNLNDDERKISSTSSLISDNVQEIKKEMFSYVSVDANLKVRLSNVLAMVGIDEASIIEKSKDFIDILVEAVTDFTETIKKYDSILNEVSQAEQKQEKLQSVLKNLRKEYSNQETIVVKKETEKKNFKDHLKKLLDKVKGLSEEDIRKELQSVSSKTESLKTGLETAKENLKKLDQELGEKKAKLHSLIEHLKVLTDDGKIDFAAIGTELDSLISNQPFLEQENKKYSVELTTNKNILASTKEKGKSITSLEKRRNILEKLAKVASGSISGNKTTLEAHVQGYYMDKVVEEARSFLRNVSGGRYELVRRTSQGGRAKTGLDLNVIDLQNGCSERSVSSLSGGESFSGALSLLIALSNVVQSFNGGAENNIIFVDEGFGSLDERFLERVIKAQNELSNNNRSIGIISHRPELEENIPLKLTVKAEDVGGFITSRIGYEGV